MSTYARGLIQLGDGCFAYLQPTGSWGLSNAGLVACGGESLLVDTFYDLAHTRELLAAVRAAAPRDTARIGTVVNTHHNGDHCWGNQLVEGAEIIASRAAAAAMEHETPAMLHGFVQAAPGMGELGQFLLHCFGRFEFSGIQQKLPTVTFSGRLEREVGGRRVELIEVGPAHTPGDVIVHLPAARAVFTGDILFVESHPVCWAGPIGHWIDACQTILDLGAETIVPGHGPITDARGVRAMMRYLGYVHAEAKKRHEAGLPLFEAAADIALTDYSSWGDAERIVVNVAAVYRELEGDRSPPDVPMLFGMMAKLAKR
jgi:glyoxylase-like metal-dependent hydrolase (beta-lactamase superfamily II)